MAGPLNGTGDPTIDDFSLCIMTRSRDLRFGTLATSAGNPLRSSIVLGPAELSMQSPRARMTVSSQRGIRVGDRRAGCCGDVVLSNSLGLITQYTISCPAGPVIRNEPCEV